MLQNCTFTYLFIPLDSLSALYSIQFYFVFFPVTVILIFCGGKHFIIYYSLWRAAFYYCKALSRQCIILVDKFLSNYHLLVLIF
jgi:hypothetical protein